MKENRKFEALKLEKQLCFPLYAASKEIIRRYKPYLDEIDLTYTQYIVMMVLWDRQKANVKELGEALYLDSGTLTPVLKKLEAKGYLTRHRSAEDERSLVVAVTDEGMDLRKKATGVPDSMAACMKLSPEEFDALYALLYKLLGNVVED